MLITVVAIYSAIRCIIVNLYECIEHILLGSGMLMKGDEESSRTEMSA